MREVLTLVAEKAPALRTAGVLELELGELAFTLAPSEPALPTGTQEGGDDMGIDDDRPSNPLDDPRTFGRKKAPKLRRTDDEE